MSTKRKAKRKNETTNGTATVTPSTSTILLDVEDFTPDTARCEQGRWITHPERPGAEFLIASTTQNPKWDAALFKSARRIQERCQAAGVEPDSDTSAVADTIRREETSTAIAAGLMLKWRGVNKGGKPLPATDKNRAWFALNVRWVTNWIIEEASKRGNFRESALERDSGN